jgi:hypothetical protein
MGNPVTHFEVVGQDAGALARFYGELFGWQMQDVMDGGYYMVNTGVDGAIAGGVGASQDASRRSPCLATPKGTSSGSSRAPADVGAVATSSGRPGASPRLTHGRRARVARRPDGAPARVSHFGRPRS